MCICNIDTLSAAFTYLDMRSTLKPIIIILTALLIITINLYSQTDLDGTWGGAIDIMGTELVIFINFTPDTEMLRATIDIPQQGATNLTLSNVRCENLFISSFPPGRGQRSLTEYVIKRKSPAHSPRRGYAARFI
jgi:hypothetical protein